ncbi:gamma-glutamyltransferase family protein [Burkholderiales bacterium]|nr:gamma-glutamyltransferase family protein [Burkholderiales bacterium]
MVIFPDAHRSAIFGDNIVSTSQPLAAQAGLSMMHRGGNAVDAAIASAITLTVVEPTMNGIGSDAFCLIWDGQKIHGLNAAGKYPEKWKHSDFKQYKTMPDLGWKSVSVPGAVSSWVALSRRFGRLRFEDLFEPAIRYARDGFSVSPIIADQWKKQINRFAMFDEFQRIFTRHGRTPMPGERFRLPDHAESLEEIAKTYGEAFYRGELAQLMVNDSLKNGGKLSLNDLEDHDPTWTDPITTEHKGFQLHEIPPSSQGIAVLIANGILNELEDVLDHANDVIKIHLEIESMKLALDVTHSEVSDPSYMRKTNDELLSDTLIRSLAKKVSVNKVSRLPIRQTIQSDTVYLTSADSDGMMVSFIQSNYMGFGSGIVVPNTGISLQNRAAGFNLTKNHPNCLDGGKFPFHTIIPGFITKNGNPISSFGVMGGDMQAQGHLQIFRQFTKQTMNPQEIVNAPRWKVSKDGTLLVENTFGQDILDGLKLVGHKVLKAPYGTYDFGAAQMIIKEKNSYVAGSEPRRDGQAVTF